MSFPPQVKELALIACGRCCSICHKFCGVKMECHHIIPDADGGPHTFENCIPLCFECHADMKSSDPSHPKGTTYRPNELKAHRDNWYEKIKNPGLTNYNDVHRKLDCEMFMHLVAILPWQGSMSFIDTNNFGFRFRVEQLDQLDEVMARCGDPAFEFIDPVLEMMRAGLCSNISAFLSLIDQYTSPVLNAVGNLNAIHDSDDWTDEDRPRLEREVAEIHAASYACVESYKKLMREVRYRLQISLP